MTAGSYCYIGPQGIVHGTTVSLSSETESFSGSVIGEACTVGGRGGTLDSMSFSSFGAMLASSM